MPLLNFTESPYVALQGVGAQDIELRAQGPQSQNVHPRFSLFFEGLFPSARY